MRRRFVRVRRLCLLHLLPVHLAPRPPPASAAHLHCGSCGLPCGHQSGESSRPLTPILLKSIAIHLPFLSRYFCKSMPSRFVTGRTPTEAFYRRAAKNCIFGEGDLCEQVNFQKEKRKQQTPSIGDSSFQVL